MPWWGDGLRGGQTKDQSDGETRSRAAPGISAHGQRVTHERTHRADAVRPRPSTAGAPGLGRCGGRLGPESMLPRGPRRTAAQPDASKSSFRALAHGTSWAAEAGGPQ